MTDHALWRPASSPLFRSAAPLLAAGFLTAAVVGVALAVDLRLGAAGILLVTYGPVVLIDLPLGAVIWIPTAFVDRLTITGPASTVMLLMFAVAWFGALPGRLQDVRDAISRHRGVFMSLCLMLTWFGVSVLWSSDVGEAVDAWLAYVVVGAVFSLLVTTMTLRRYAVIACAAFVVGAVISIVAGFVPGATDRFEITGEEASRLSGALGDPNYLASGLVPAMALAAGLLSVARSGVMRAVLIVTIGFLAIGLVLSGSRGALVAGAVVVAAALALARGRRLQLGGLILLVAAVAGLWVATTSPQAWNRIRDFENDTGRQDLWTVALRMAEDNIVTGVGVGNFEAESGTYARRPGSLERADLILEDPHVAHNVYLQALAETGIVGLGLLLLVLAAVLRASWFAGIRFEAAGNTALAALARAVLVAQIGMLSASLFMSDGYDSRLWISLALGPALGTAAARELKRLP